MFNKKIIKYLGKFPRGNVIHYTYYDFVIFEGEHIEYAANKIPKYLTRLLTGEYKSPNSNIMNW